MAIYCFTDLHGRYELWKQIKEYLKEDDIAYCLGDCIDRGKDGYKILKEVIDDERITLLLGNHEDFFLECVPEFFQGHFGNYDLWCEYNGGSPTWEAVQSAPVEEVMQILHALKRCPLHKELVIKDSKKIFLSHSGYNPWEIANIYIKNGNKVRSEYLWNREHFHYPWRWAKKEVDDFDFENSYIIHGHTPVQQWTGWKDDYLNDPSMYDPRINVYDEGHKINLDLCSVESNRVALFNLDTFKEVYFECENEDLEW